MANPPPRLHPGMQIIIFSRLLLFSEFSFASAADAVSLCTQLHRVFSYFNFALEVLRHVSRFSGSSSSPPGLRPIPLPETRGFSREQAKRELAVAIIHALSHTKFSILCLPIRSERGGDREQAVRGWCTTRPRPMITVRGLLLDHRNRSTIPYCVLLFLRSFLLRYSNLEDFFLSSSRCWIYVMPENNANDVWVEQKAQQDERSEDQKGMES